MIHLLNNGMKIGYINYRVEKFIEKPNVIICFKCSQFGHTQSSCKFTQKCFRCSNKDHSSKSCPFKLDKNNQKCPNCHGPHPATYAGCKAFKEQLMQLHEKKNSQSQSNNNKYNSNNLKNNNNNFVTSNTPTWSKEKLATATTTTNDSEKLNELYSKIENISDKFEQYIEKMNNIIINHQTLQLQITDICSKSNNIINQINNLEINNKILFTESLRTTIIAFNLMCNDSNSETTKKAKHAFQKFLTNNFNLKPSDTNLENIPFEKIYSKPTEAKIDDE